MNSMAASFGFAARRSVVSFGGGLLSGGCMLQENRAAPHELTVTAKMTNIIVSVFLSGELISLSLGGVGGAFLALGSSLAAVASTSASLPLSGFSESDFPPSEPLWPGFRSLAWSA